MITDAKAMRCGNCGGSTFAVYSRERAKDELLVECDACKAVSVVSVTKPELTIGWAPDNDKGIITVF